MHWSTWSGSWSAKLYLGRSLYLNGGFYAIACGKGVERRGFAWMEAVCKLHLAIFFELMH